jgi:hypothetical protein
MPAEMAMASTQGWCLGKVIAHEALFPCRQKEGFQKVTDTNLSNQISLQQIPNAVMVHHANL